MNTPEKHHHAQQIAAGEAINDLRELAEAGDPEAVAALRDVAIHAIRTLEKIDLGDVPKNSWQWPVTLDAVGEIRKAALKRWGMLEVGSSIGIRLEGKRVFVTEKPTGYALEIYRMIQPVRKRGKAILEYLASHQDSKRSWRDRAAKLPPLSAESLELWEDVAIDCVKEMGMGDWQLIPVPDSALTKVGKDPSRDGWDRTEDSALREKISEGFKMLISKARP